jgi:hypothetical protein
MKIIISREFDTIEAALEFLQSHGGRTPQQSSPQLGLDLLPGQIVRPQEDIVRVYKVRSDKGQKRGPYRKRQNTVAEAPIVTPNPVSEPVVVDAPKNNEERSGQQVAPVSGSIPDAPLSINDVKAHMSKLSRKHGPDANMKLLADFGVPALSQLSPEKYADFVAAVKAAFAK